MKKKLTSGDDLVVFHVRILLFIAAFGLALPFGANSQILISEIAALNDGTVAGPNASFPDWVELHNTGSSSVDLAGMGLTDDPNQPKKAVIKGIQGKPLILMADGCYVLYLDKSAGDDCSSIDLQLSGNGEFLGLSDASGRWLDSLRFPVQSPFYTYGRGNIRGGLYGYLERPTPGTQNPVSTFTGMCSAPSFSVMGGRFNQKFTLTIKAPLKGAKIYYTLDGSSPTKEKGLLYVKPLVIDRTVVVRAVAISQSLLPSMPVTATYLFGETTSLPIFSLCLPDSVLSNTTASQFENTRWLGHVELMYKDAPSSFSTIATISIPGQSSRMYKQKPFKINFSEHVGLGAVSLPFLSQNSRAYSSILLRNAGNDIKDAFLRDALAHVLTQPANLEQSAYHPAVIYVNGNFYGLLNLREFMGDEYFQLALSTAETNFETRDFPQGGKSIEEGYNLKLLLTGSKDTSNFTVIDPQNTIDYLIAEIFCGNNDWMLNNIRLWRPASPSNTWRWIFQDVDMGFQRSRIQKHKQPNTLGVMLGNNLIFRPERTNALLESSAFFRELFEDKDFKIGFLFSFCHQLNTWYHPHKTTRVLDSLAGKIQPEIARHSALWAASGLMQSEYFWQQSVDEIREFLHDRPSALINYAKTEFNTQTAVSVAFRPTEGGTLSANSYVIAQELKGLYFSGCPFTIRAVPKEGFEFVGWENLPDKAAEVLVTPTADMLIAPLFRRVN